MAKTIIRPGNNVPLSGQYGIIGPKGGNTGKEVTLIKDHIAPPSPKAGQQYVIVDPTKNKSGRPESLADFYPESKWKRCPVHFYRNVFSVVPSGKVRQVALLLKASHA